MAARLEITDGTTTIDLIQTGGNPFYLNYWRPSIIQPKGGGTYQQSSLSDGRRLVDRKYNNATETFDISVRGDDPDALAAALHDLRVLLEKAVSYWITNYQDVPVYLIAQSDCEENERYAIIHNWSTPEDENPYSQPFQQSDQAAVMDSWTLLIERGDWLENVPGESTCVQISGSQDVAIGTDVIAYPTASTDDAFTDSNAGTINTGGVGIGFGATVATTYDAGIRFRDVQVPPGATISSAFVRFTASENQAGGVISLSIYGERNDEPAAFSTYLDFTTRARTTTYTNWVGVAAWTAGNTYDTVDLADIIQEIVNLGNWEQGDDLVIFVEDNGSGGGAYRVGASWDNVTYDEPELHVTFADRVAGRTETCDDEVYITNKQSLAQITHVYHLDWNTGAWSTNLIGAVPPYLLFPNPIGVSDAIFFGIDTSESDTGPFSNLVFDIDIANAPAPNDIETNWRYWNGAAFANFAVEEDHTDAGGGTAFALSELGVNSIHWEIPTDWATSNLNTIYGGAAPNVTGYWTQCIVVGLNGTPVIPRQANRDVYTIIWPRIEIAAAQAKGDIAAILRIDGDEEDLDGNDIIQRVIVGLRSVSRGENFTACLNASDEQNPSGITVSVGTDTAFANLVGSPTGRIAQYNPSGVDAIAYRVGWLIDETLSPEYGGKFQTFVRYITTGSTTEYTARLRVMTQSIETVHTSETKTIAAGATTNFGVVGFDAIELPPYHAHADLSDSGDVYIRMDIGSSDGTDNLQIVDLWTMPVDEWAIDADHNGSPPILDFRFDSLTDLRRMVRTAIYDGSGYASDVFTARKNGPAILQANARQRLWFLMFTQDVSNRQESYMYHSLRLQLFRNQRYFSYRGAG